MDESSCEELALCTREPLARLDVGFEDLCYTARSWRNSDGTYVLKSVSGQFQSGKLTAILGPSGAGKSTLMDILSGFRRNGGVSGRLLSNGRPRVPRIFRRLSCHVPQEDLLQSKMTAEESLLVSARLKMPPALARSEEHRANVVKGVLKTLGLLKCKDTMVEQLSGGQRKRLSIALELVSNPSVFFLDEPTTGLDSVAMRDCVSLLKLLAEQGRTVVATLHQPPASILLGKVDHLYVLVRGQCVYQGCPHGLAPFLAYALHPQPACPISHNPADFVIETTQGPNEANVILLTMEILNGKRTCSMVEPSLGDDGGGEAYNDPGPSTSEKTLSVDPVKYDSNENDESKGTEASVDLNIVVQGPSEWNQFLILLGRMVLQMRRNKVALYLQLLHYTLTGLIMSLIYGKHLNDAGQMFLNLKFCLGITVFFTYTQIMVPVLVFPSEVSLLRREHFNGWYHLRPYYAALTISRLPLQLILGFLFLALCYFITDQPLELPRFTYYCILGLGTSVAAEGVGLAIGSLFSVLNGAAMGPLCMATLLCFAIHGIDYARQVGFPMKLLIHTSFMRPSFIGLIKALYGSGRGKLQCPSGRRSFCVYKDPAILIRYLDLEENGQFSGSIWSSILLLIFLGVLCRLIAFLALKWRLSVNKPNIRLVYILKKFFSR